jgi:hypothetical protein
MKKIILPALLLAAAASPAQAANRGLEMTWGVCGTAFPGLGPLAGQLDWLLPCVVLGTPSHA